MLEFKGAIFDLDGTIADSEYVWQKVDRDFFKMYGMDIPSDYVEKISSMSFKQTAEYTKERFKLETDIEKIMSIWHEMAVNEYRHNVKLKPFVYEYIEYLKNRGIKIALCTASPAEFYEPVLKRNNIYDFFDAFTSGMELSTSKEKPHIFILTAEKLKLSPTDCVVFEDIEKAIDGAKLAGMKTVGVFDKAQEKNIERIKQKADLYIYSFGEMLK